MLELLPRLESVSVRHHHCVDLVVLLNHSYLGHVRESVDDESPAERSVGHIIILNGNRGEGLQGFQLRDLNERVDIVIEEYEFLQFLEALKFPEIRVVHNVVKAHILETYLFHALLELGVVQHFQSVSIDEEQIVAFDLSVA